MLTDANGEERKGIEVDALGYVVPRGENCEDVAEMFNKRIRFLSSILSTIRDLMLAGV